MYPFEQFTLQAKRVLTLAQEEAERSHHAYIGTEHLLFGLFRVEEGRAAQALAALGVDAATVRATIQSVLGRNERIIIQQIIPTSRVKTVIEISFDEARRAGSKQVGTEHLLLGLLTEGEGIAAHMLNDFGASMERVRAQLAQLPAVEAPGAVNRGLEGFGTDTSPRDEEQNGVAGDVIARARRLAADRGDPMGTEHVLLALADQPSERAGAILGEHGLTRAVIEAKLGESRGESGTTG